MRAITILLLCCFSVIGFSQNNQHFEEANALYNDNKYAEAIDKYESILDTEVHSAELYFNLGNANYKLNNIAPTIYYYEKALQLNPNDKEIENNLAYAQNMTIDAIDSVPEVGFSRIINNVVNTFQTSFRTKYLFTNTYNLIAKIIWKGNKRNGRNNVIDFFYPMLFHVRLKMFG